MFICGLLKSCLISSHSNMIPFIIFSQMQKSFLLFLASFSASLIYQCRSCLRNVSLSIMDTIQCCNLCFRIPVMRREMCSHHKCINIWIEFCICVCFICRHSFFLSFILLILFNKVHPPQPWNGLGYIFHRELSWNINSCHWPSS